MSPLPPRSTRTDTLFPYPTLFRSEIQGIEKIVCNAPIEDVDRRIALRRAHRDAPVDNAKVMPLDQFGAHLVGEEAVLEIGAVVDARSQQDRKSTRLNSRH